MFGWLLGKDKKHQARASSKSTARKPASHSHDAQDSVLPDLTQQLGHSKAALEEASSRAMQQRREQRKVDRMGRREALFGIVREVMLRSGILSSAYKFKVLSIDQKGRHFLVLLDLSMELAQSEPAERLLEVEKLIADTAMARMQVVVQAVYWRHFVPGQAATIRLSSGDTQPGGLSAHIGMGHDTGAPKENQPSGSQTAEVATTERKSEHSAADAISTALAELRAKNRAKAQERAAEQQANTAAGATPLANAADNTTFAATQMIAASRLATEEAGQTAFFAETQMQNHPGQADEDELAAFQRALQQASVALPAAHTAPIQEQDGPASIFISGKALDGQLEEHYNDGNIDLSGTQYGELPNF